MVDVTAGLFWYRTKEWCGIMADKLNGVVYTDDSKETVDIINLLLFGWILLALIVYIVGTLIAKYLRKRKSTFTAQKEVGPADASTADDKYKEHVSSAPECSKTVQSEDILEIPRVYEVPKCEGEDIEIVEWINCVFQWIYSQKVVSPIIDAWLSALNARTRLSSTEHGILVDFKDILHTKKTPIITDVRQRSSSRSDSVVSFNTEVEDTSFEVLVTQFKEKGKIVIRYRLNLKRLSGQVDTECNTDELIFVAKYSEAPQIQLSVEEVDNPEISQEDSEPLKDLVCEIGTEALSSTIVNLRLSCFPDCPRLQTNTYSSEYPFETPEDDREKHLLVKIIKASNLGGKQGDSLSPYCVVEMDEPPQKFETQPAKNTQSPFWDESFTFVVKDASAELLFEIYDKENPSKEDGFMGLGIVSVEELLSNPSQRQIIPLQSQPLQKDDDVTGALIAEFLFLNQTTPVTETTHFSRYPTEETSGKTIETNSRVTAGGTVITTTTIKRTKEGMLTSDL